MLIFSNKADADLASLVKAVDEVAKSNPKLGSVAVGISGVSEDELKKFAQEQKVTATPLTVAEDKDGPPNYKLSKDAAVTVVIYNTPSKPTVANYAFKSTKDAAAAAASFVLLKA